MNGEKTLFWEPILLYYDCGGGGGRPFSTSLIDPGGGILIYSTFWEELAEGLYDYYPQGCIIPPAPIWEICIFPPRVLLRYVQREKMADFSFTLSCGYHIIEIYHGNSVRNNCLDLYLSLRELM
jgi:hypothetical protein